ncbi:MAG: hypothetical protein FJZ97_14785 [Chloroflexi bacterium]|nr:hypothetical protein [Chloroflexota bacterium]
MRRYLEQVMETVGLYNTAGFNDDTRAFCSIPARHDVWRRVSCGFLAGLVLQGRVEEAEAFEMAAALAVHLAARAYRLQESSWSRRPRRTRATGDSRPSRRDRPKPIAVRHVPRLKGSRHRAQAGVWLQSRAGFGATHPTRSGLATTAVRRSRFPRHSEGS